MKTSIGTAVAASAVASVTGNVGGNVTGSVGSVTGAVGSVTGAVGSVTGLTNATIADQVWDEILSGHVISGSAGEALTASGGAGDPWITALPGSYSAGQAGYILGTNLNATVSSRLASAGYTAPLDAAATRSAVGMASANLDTQIGTLATASNLAVVAGYLDTEIAAIKAKTDNLPASPAAVGSAMTLSTAGYEAAADALLNRNVSGGSNTGRLVKQAYHFIRNRWVVAGGTLTVYDTDDTTSSWTAAVTGTTGADPVTGSDPA